MRPRQPAGEAMPGSGPLEHSSANEGGADTARVRGYHEGAAVTSAPRHLGAAGGNPQNEDRCGTDGVAAGDARTPRGVAGAGKFARQAVAASSRAP
jgi:hypothetical protein